MANILDFLRGLLTDAEEQQRFAGNPFGYVTAHGFADLSGEDVTEAIRRLAPTLRDGAGERLSCYTRGDREIPPVRPQIGETELDAAVRQLHFAVSLSQAAGPADIDTTEHEPDLQPEGEREPVSTGTDTEPTRMTAPAEGVPSYAALGDEVAAIVRTTGERMEAALARAQAILRDAEREAAGIREAAQVDAETVRGQANEEAEAVLQSAQSQREEAEGALETARVARGEAQRDAAEIVHTAERESDSMLAEARAKREEIRAAEQELRRRLEGVQSVFQSLEQGSVVSDD